MGSEDVTFIWNGPEALARLNARLLDRLDKAGAVVEARARELVPVDTGALQASISREVVAVPGGVACVITAGGPPRYAGHVHEGRPAGREPRPFLARALAESIPEIDRIMRTGR